jgi:hypothetical protein
VELPPAPGASDASEEFASLSPDGQILATVGKHGKTVARLWDATTGELLSQCAAGDTRCRFWVSTAFSPDGRLLATGPYDRDDGVCLWDVATCKEVARLRGHHGGVLALAFSPDGRFLASGGGDATILIWDLTGRTGGNRPPQRLSQSRLEERWEDLGGEDARAAYRAVRALAADPARSVPFLAERLLPTDPEDPAGRDKRSRQSRAVTALEYSATPASRRLLQTLAEANDATCLAGEARSALTRSNRPP